MVVFNRNYNMNIQIVRVLGIFKRFHEYVFTYIHVYDVFFAMFYLTNTNPLLRIVAKVRKSYIFVLSSIEYFSYKHRIIELLYLRFLDNQMPKSNEYHRKY